MSSNGKVILPPDQPQRFEGRNIRTPKRSNQSDDIYLLQFEVSREAWEALETIPKTAVLEGIIWYNDGDGAQFKVSVEKPKQKKELNAYSRYWQQWRKPNTHGAAAIHHPDLATALELDGEEVTADTVHEALRSTFGVVSLSRSVSPEDFEAWLKERHLDGLITLSRNFSARLEQADAKAS